MANNFRLLGGHFWSKAGHDSNTGTTSETPKKSLTASISGTGNLVVGAGVYTVPSGTMLTGGANDLARYADGLVIIDFASRNDIGGFPNQGLTVPYYNFWFKNHTNASTYRSNFTDCAFENVNVTSVSEGQRLSLTRCKVIGCSMTPSLGLWNITYSIIMSSNILIVVATNYVQNTYVGSASSITLPNYTAAAQVASNKNNNVQGILVIGGLKYAIKDQYTGTPQDAGYASDVYWLTEANLTANGYTGQIVGWNAAVATCINRDPRFNDASKLDFTLKADSPHIGRASDGVSNIGGTQYAQSFYAGESNPNIILLQASSEIDTTTNPYDWRLNVGQTQGTIRAIIKVSNTNEVLGAIPYIGNYAFNSDSTPGTSTNFNVPDSKPQSNGYPSYSTTTSTASDAYRVVIANHGFSAGVWLKVDGQYREVSSVTTNELIFLTAVRAAVISGTAVQVGSKSSLTALNPNRLGYRLRTSKSSAVDASNYDNPLTWDNDGLAPAGNYLEQEWNRQPLIDNLNQVGFGDDNYDSNYGNQIQMKYIDIMIYLRNDYKS